MNGTSTGGVLEVEVKEAAELLAEGKAKMLDVREDNERTSARIPDTVHIPMMQIPQRLDDIERDATWIIQCHSGARSMQIARFLLAQGYEDVMNLRGGILAWHQNGLPIEQG